MACLRQPVRGQDNVLSTRTHRAEGAGWTSVGKRGSARGRLRVGPRRRPSPASRMPGSLCQMPNGRGHPRWRSQSAADKLRCLRTPGRGGDSLPGPRFGGANEVPSHVSVVRSTLDPVLRIDPVRLELPSN